MNMCRPKARETKEFVLRAFFIFRNKLGYAISVKYFRCVTNSLSILNVQHFIDNMIRIL